MRRNRITNITLILICMWLCTVTASAHTADIPIEGENRYKAIRLTPAIYNAANGDLSDLRLLDGGGEPVPYFLREGAPVHESVRESYPMELINAYLKDDRFYFDYRLAGEREEDVEATSLSFTTSDTPFAKELTLYGSYDNLHWEHIRQDTLYSVEEAQKLAIEFGQTLKYTHYRLELANNLEQIEFDSASLLFDLETTGREYFIETVTPPFTVESGGRQTKIVIDGLANLRLCDITIETGSMFQRMAATPDGTTKELFNLSLNGTSYTDTTIRFAGYVRGEEGYAVTISDGDDQPVDIAGVTVRYYADEMVFEGKPGETYTLEFGADPAKKTPVYDITRYQDEILRNQVDHLSVSRIIYTVSEQPPAERDYRIIFNIVIIVVAVLMGGIILMKLRQR